MKRDINLLPRRKAGGASTGKTIAIAIALTILYVLIFGTAIKVPLDQKSELQSQVTSRETQVLALQPGVDEYNLLLAEIKELQSKIDNKQEIIFAKRTSEGALKILQDNCPTDIMILSVSTTLDSIQISAKAKSDEQVAQFILQLERTGEFVDIQLNGTSPTDVVTYDTGEAENSIFRQFSLVLIYDNSPPAEAEPEASTEGGQ